MFKHTLLLIYRTLQRDKSTFFINLIGLSCGLASVLIVYLWVNDELSFDKYHQNDKRLFQVMSNTKSEKGVETKHDTPHTLSENLPQEMPEVEYATTVTPDRFFPSFILSANDKKVKGAGKFAGKDFFKIFSYHIIQGKELNVLSGKNSIAVSESQAKSLFGTTENVIGKTVSYEMPGLKRECVITGVFKDVPVNSSEHFDFVVSFDAFKEIMGMQPNWNAEPFVTYLTLKQSTNAGRFDNKLTAYYRAKSKLRNVNLFLKPFSDNYLYSKYENGKVVGGRIEYVRLFSLIAAFILVISCINFINLSTAKAAKRVKEIGIKKVIGAGRKVLIIQYMAESFLMSFLALVTAVLITILLLPEFNKITQKSLHFYFNTKFCVALAGITLLTGLLSGVYPALYLSGFKPVTILKGRLSSSLAEQVTRKGLVIFQFSLSIIFIVSVLVLYKQLDYVLHKNLGVDKNNVIYFQSEGNAAAGPDVFLNEIQKIPGIEAVSSMVGNLVADQFGAQGTLKWNGKTISVHSFGVNYGMIETLGIKIKEGRSFSKSFGANNTQLILNEAAVQAMGLKNPVGTIMEGQGNNIEIIGVVKNFHFQSLHEQVMPANFRLDNLGASTIVVRIKPGKQREALSGLEKIYKSFNPGFTFEYRFLDQDYQALYASEKQVSVLARYFAGLTILISCLGLFGLSAFTTEMRFKEIGIRKVLGSSMFGIIRQLSQEFTALVIIASCVAVPFSYLIARKWLDGFAFKIELHWWYFFGAGLTTITVALVTVSYQSFKAARMNPVKSLKAE
jgi:putative ABC transport system permease protein